MSLCFMIVIFSYCQLPSLYLSFVNTLNNADRYNALLCFIHIYNVLCLRLFPFSPQIIDSIMALFRVDFSGRGELAERQQKLAQMLSRLQKISEGLATSLAYVYANYAFKSAAE